MKKKTYRWLSAFMLVILLFTEAGSLPVVWAAGDDGSVSADEVSENDTAEAEVSENNADVSDNEVEDPQDDIGDGDGLISDPIDENVEELTYVDQDEDVQVPDDVQDGEVTRLEWWQMLISAFHMTVEEDNYPDNYYYDMNSSSDFYRDVMVATEFGLVDVEAGDSVSANDPATREFAVYTLIRCIGYFDTYENYTFNEYDDVEDPDAIQASIDNGWFALSSGDFLPDKAVTSDELANAKTVAEQAYESIQIDASHENSYKLKAGVIDLGEQDVVLTGEDELTFNNAKLTDLNKDDIFVFMFSGVPFSYKAENVQVDGDNTIVSYTSIEAEYAFESLDEESSHEIDLKDFKAPEENSDYVLSYIVGGTAAKDFEDGIEYSTLEAVGEREVSALRITTEVDVPAEEVEDVGDSTLSASVTVSNTNWDVKAKPFSGYGLICLNGDIKTHVGISATADSVAPSLMKEIKKRLSFDMTYGPLKFSIKPDVSIDGKLALNMVHRFSLGVEYKSGKFRLIKKFEKKSFTLNCEVNINIGLIVEAGFDIAVFKGKVYAKIGAHCDAAFDMEMDDGSYCLDVFAYVYCTVGAEAKLNLLVVKKSWKEEKVIWNAKNSPVKLAFHYEDGKAVDTCTRGQGSGEILDPDDPSNQSVNPNVRKNKYYTPVNSRYGSSGLNTGTGSDGKQYTIFETSKNDNGKICSITKYNGNVSTLNVPEEIDGYKVVSISSGVFENRKELVYVTLPDAITSIGEQAFLNCENLTGIDLPDELLYMGDAAFKNCKSLESITIPKKVDYVIAQYPNAPWKWHDGVFCGCDSLKQVEFQDGIEIIPNYIFMKAYSIETVKLPNTVKEIGSGAFRGCYRIKDINFPEGLTEIHYEAFWNCNGFKNLVFPESLKTIDSGAFMYCYYLESVNLCKVENLYSAAFRGCERLTEVTLPKTLKSGSYSGYADDSDSKAGVFCGCKNLNKICFEEGITSISDGLFAEIETIETIEIPDTVTYIGYKAFYNSNFKSISLPNSLVRIRSEAFAYCRNLTSIKMPDSVRVIEYEAFSNCMKLSEVRLPCGISEIEEGAFYNCDGLTEILIPKSISKVKLHQYIDNYPVFGACDKLAKIQFEEGTTAVISNMFNGCLGLEEIVIPDTIEYINGSAFSGCKNLTSIKLSQNLKEISGSAFEKCSSLQSVSIPESVGKIGKSSFKDCVSLNSVEIKGSIKSIEDSTFEGCSVLLSVNIPNSVESIGNNAFSNCKLLDNVVIPDNTETLGSKCFSGCTSLKSIRLGLGITSIPQYSFADNESLKEIVLPLYTESIKAYAFQNDANLESITIPRTTTAIPTNAFTFKDKLVIYGVAGSYAETFANSKGFTFVSKEVKATGLSFSEDSYTIKTKTTLRLPYTVTPSDTTDEIIWVVSKNDDKVFVKNGVVTGIKATDPEDPAIIKLCIGDQIASCKIFVQQSVTGIVLNTTSIKIDAGLSFQLTATVSPSDANDKTITWSSTDENIATVDENGNVTAVGKGSCDVVATANDGGGASASCKITVTSDMKLVTTADEMQSEHPYGKNISDVYEITGGETISVTFSEDTKLEENTEGDYIEIFEANGRKKYYGTELAGKTVTTTSPFWMKFVSDGVDTKDYGFAVSKIEKDVVAIELKGITVSPASLTLTEGTSGTLSAVLTPSNASDKSVSWASSEPSVATVSGNGLTASVNAIKAGKATITASAGAFSATATITVVKEGDPIIEVTGISIAPEQLSVGVGSVRKLKATITPDDATDQTVYWTSSDDTIATVTGSGLEAEVKGVKEGTAIITAMAGSFSTTATVTVTKEAEQVIVVTGISVSPNELSIKAGSTGKLNAVITPDDATDKTVSWNSSDTAVATVTGNGLGAEVKGIKAGTATITATCGEFSATATVKVTWGQSNPGDTLITEITLNHSEVSMMEGKKLAIEASIKPISVSNDELYWESDNEDVVKVSVDEEDYYKAEITAVSEGTATVTVHATDGSEVSASCIITVRKEGAGGPGEAEEGKVYVAAKGKADAGSVIKASLSADVAARVKKYSSSNKKIASVSKKGIVTGKKAGTVTITAYVKNGKKYEAVGTVEVIVSKPVFNFGSTTLTNVDEPLYLYDYIKDLPKGTLVSWSIPKSKANIAVIDGDEVVATGKSGTVTVTCTIGTGKMAVKYKAKLKAVMPPYLPEETVVKLNKWKTITLYNAPKGKKIEWMWGTDNADGSIKIKPSGNKCKVKVTNDDHDWIAVIATVDGETYRTEIIVE